MTPHRLLLGLSVLLFASLTLQPFLAICRGADGHVAVEIAMQSPPSCHDVGLDNGAADSHPCNDEQVRSPFVREESDKAAHAFVPQTTGLLSGQATILVYTHQPPALVDRLIPNSDESPPPAFVRTTVLLI